MFLGILAVLLSFSSAQTSIFVSHRVDGLSGNGTETDPFSELSLAFTKDSVDGLIIWVFSSDSGVEFGNSSCENLKSQVFVS
jgi:hypothetical protein